MATFVLDGPLGEGGSPVAAAGVALSTTAALVQLPPGTQHVTLEARNYSTAVVAVVKLNPYLAVLRTQDLLATATDYSAEAQDASTSTSITLSSQGAAADGDFLYVGAHLPFRGVSIDVDAPNGTANTLTVKYRKSDNTWADASATDATDTGASLAVDGTVTWTVPTDWIPCKLSTVESAGSGVAHANAELYWTRWEWTTGLDSATTLDSMLALSRNKTTAGIQLVSGRVLAFQASGGVGGIGCIEATTDAGTANLLVNCFSVTGKGFV